MRRLFIAVAAIVVLAGCTSTAEPESTRDSATTAERGESATEETVERIDPETIESMEEGIAWARSLDDTATADELTLGIERITDHLLDEEIEFETSNEIGQGLMALQDAVDDAPETAGAKVAELTAIVDRIETAISAAP